MRRRHSRAGGQAWGALVALAIAGLPAAAEAQRPTQTISRADIESAGWTRLSELVFAVRGAARGSADGITVLGNVSGLPEWDIAPDAGEWLILVDGQPVQATFGGATVLDLLPVALSQVDSVTVRDGPAFVAGRLAARGALQLFTRRSADGIAGSVSHYSGNEVGDPGPFTFTPERTPNVDNSGPFHEGRITYGAPGWDIDAAVRRWTDNLTDPGLVERYAAASPTEAPELWVRHIAPVLRASYTAGTSGHDVHAGAAQLRGTFFVPSVREDQSLDTRLWFGGVSGGTHHDAAMPWSYRLHASRLEASSYGAPLPSTLASDRQQAGAAVNVGRRLGSAVLAAGGEVIRHELSDAPSLDGRSRLLSTATGSAFAEFTSVGAWNPHVVASLGRGIDAMRGSMLLSVARGIDSVSDIELLLAADARAAGDDGAWVDLELLRLGELATERRTTLASRFTARRRLDSGLHLNVAGSLRRETGLRIVRPDSTTRLPAATLTGPTASASIGELRASVDLPVAGRVQGGATYRLSGVIAAPDDFRDASRSVPRHLLDASVVIAPARDIRIRPAIHLASATEWRGAATTLEPVPAVTRLDLSVEKWFLRRRLRAHLLARNLLNDVERYHALGADFRMRVYAGATLSF